MIKINKKDSIIDIIIKINNCKKKEIVLDFPFGHPILHSSTSLRILKNKAAKKDLIIITSDKTAKKIWKKLWIKYSEIWDEDLLEYNYTFFEYFKYIIKRYIAEAGAFFTNKTPDIVYEYQKKNQVNNSKIWFFLLWLILSVFLFIFIFYFAVNKTYIHITPEITIKNRALNFVFRETEKDEITTNNIIELNKITKTVSLSKTFWTTWINIDTIKRAKWKVTFYNELNENIELLKNTRLQTDSWILFSSDTEIKIPRATVSSTWALIPWKKDIYITSRIYDTNWDLTLDNANIWDWVFLTLPWLKTSQDKIYAKTKWEIKWATNTYTKQVTKKDIENAANIMKANLKQKALNSLKKQVKEDNQRNNITYQILWVDDILEYSELNIEWFDKLKPNTDLQNFSLSGSVKITSYTYNTQKVLNKLSSSIKWNILKNIEKLLFVNDQSLIISNVISKSTEPLEIKATAQVEAFYIHNFSNKESNYIQKLKYSISWMEKEKAQKILINNKKISDVVIDVRPFFVDRISKLTDNIIIEVESR